MRKILLALVSFGVLVQTASAQPRLVSKIGNFDFYTEFDPIYDEDRSFIAARSLEDNGYLAWKCQGDELEVYIAQDNQYYSADDYHTAIIRFDKHSPFEIENWVASLSKNAIFMDSGMIEDFTSLALDKSQVIIRTTDSVSKMVTSTFKLNNLKSALDKLSCSGF